MDQVTGTETVSNGQAGRKPPARDRLLTAAAQLFAEKGFGSVSVREICKAAGTTNNMVHHYFSTKDGLLEAIADRYDNHVYAVPMRLLASPATSHDDLIARVTMVFETTLEACLAERDVMMVVLREQVPLFTLQEFQKQMVAFLETAKENGLVREALDCQMISGAMLDRIINQAQFAPWIKKTSGIDVATDDVYRARWCRSNIDVFLNGMLALKQEGQQ